MGGTESTFNSLLLHEGSDEEQPLKIWLQDRALQDGFQKRPNLPLKGSPCRDTPLHCAARKEMKILMMEFLEKGADPLTRNSNSETPIHIVCTSARASSRTSRRRCDMLQLLLEKVPEVCGEESYDIIRSESSPCVEDSGVQNGMPYSVNVNLGVSDRVSREVRAEQLRERDHSSPNLTLIRVIMCLLYRCIMTYMYTVGQPGLSVWPILQN